MDAAARPVAALPVKAGSPEPDVTGSGSREPAVAGADLFDVAQTRNRHGGELPGRSAVTESPFSPGNHRTIGLDRERRRPPGCDRTNCRQPRDLHRVDPFYLSPVAKLPGAVPAPGEDAPVVSKREAEVRSGRD